MDALQQYTHYNILCSFMGVLLRVAAGIDQGVREVASTSIPVACCLCQRSLSIHPLTTLQVWFINFPCSEVN